MKYYGPRSSVLGRGMSFNSDHKKVLPDWHSCFILAYFLYLFQFLIAYSSSCFFELQNFLLLLPNAVSKQYICCLFIYKICMLPFCPVRATEAANN